MVVDVQSSGMPVQVDDLDDGFVLELLRDSEDQARAAELRRLRLATHWAERHVVAEPLDAAHFTDADLRDIADSIGGEGVPLVAAGCIEELAGVLGVQHRTALQLVSDGLDLRHRLPAVRTAMEEGRVAPWRARRIADLTRHLSVEAAAYVDGQLAPVADSCGPTRIQRLVEDAATRFDAAEQAAGEAEARDTWGVRLEHGTGTVWAGTSRLEVVGDTATLTRFHDLVCATAHELLDPAVPADEQPLELRKVAALGVIADGAGAATKTTAYLHLSPTDTLGWVEGLGTLTSDALRDWLGTSHFTLRPVLDLARTDTVDQHDPPAWMRELVVLRDRTCVHPYCDRPSRGCDLDHIEAFVEMDDGGPPGQTRPDNLAPLCRRHHRAKTHRGWTYHRSRDGSYAWTSPHGHRYPVDTRGAVTRH